MGASRRTVRWMINERGAYDENDILVVSTKYGDINMRRNRGDRPGIDSVALPINVIRMT